MTSQISKDEIEAELWKLLGPRRVNPWYVQRFMRMIDTYTITAARKWTVTDEPIPDVVLPHLPLTDVPKRSRPERTDRNPPKKAAPVQARADEKFLYLCRLCHARKPIGGFPEAKRFTPHYSYACLECYDAGRVGGAKSVPEVDGYLCRLCQDRWPLEEFPKVKRDNPVISIACLRCEDARKARDGRKLVNMTRVPIASLVVDIAPHRLE